MISVLGDYNYTFPKPIPLKLKLKDMLEDQVDEKYFLSKKMIDGMINTKFHQYQLENRLQDVESNIDTLTTSTGVSFRNNTFLAIKNANKKGYLEATEGDGVDISSRMEYHRGTVQKGKTQTLSTMGGENNGVVVEDTLKKDLCNKLIKEGKIKENDVIRHNYTTRKENNCIQTNNEMPTLDTRCDCFGVCVGTYQFAKSDNFMQGKDRLQLGKETSDTLQTTQKEGVVINPLKGISGKSWQFEQQVYDENGSARTLKASEGSGNIPKVVNDLRIRKLTPKECFRLMGVKDEDFDKVAKNQSDSSLYHLAGDSIVVNVLMAIFGEMI